MGNHVCMSGMMQCSFGVAPATLVVLPTTMELSASMPGANIMANIPMANIPPFGMCNSMANPMVIAATAAALGVMTPMPCIPVVAAPWAPGSPTVILSNMPALNDSSKAICNWGGMIQFNMAGQMTVQVP